jgi:hypothetical protein
VSKIIAIAGICAIVCLSSNTVALSDELEIANNEQIQSTAISIDREDLLYPHVLQLKAGSSESFEGFQRVKVKIRGKQITFPTTGKMNLSPYLAAGRNQIEISAIVPNPESTISLKFQGKNAQIDQSSSGTGKMQMQMTIDVL